VRDSIDAVTEAVATINGNKSGFHSAFYEVEKAAGNTSPEQRHAAPPHDLAVSIAKQEVILRVCKEMKASVAKQQEDINTLKSIYSAPERIGPTYAQITRDRMPPPDQQGEPKEGKLPAEDANWKPVRTLC